MIRRPPSLLPAGPDGFRIVDCMFDALAQMLPDEVFATSDGGNTGTSIGGWDAEQCPSVYADFTRCA